MHLLIPYVPLVDHVDPDFRAFTYGDVGMRVRKLKNDLKPGILSFSTQQLTAINISQLIMWLIVFLMQPLPAKPACSSSGTGKRARKGLASFSRFYRISTGTWIVEVTLNPENKSQQEV